MQKVFVTTDDKLVKHMFQRAGWRIASAYSEDFDLICFTGGADINPFLYGERPLPGTEWSTKRDNLEIQYWKRLEPQFPKVGICRGAQLGNVLCGGRLWQDVDNHEGGGHYVKDFWWDGIDPKTNLARINFQVSSSHHQMCDLTDDAMLLAAANRTTIKQRENEMKRYGIKVDKNQFFDPEAFFYTNFNFLGVQFHPEYSGYPQCTDYFWDLLDEFIVKPSKPAGLRSITYEEVQKLF